MRLQFETITDVRLQFEAITDVRLQLEAITDVRLQFEAITDVRLRSLRKKIGTPKSHICNSELYGTAKSHILFFIM